MAENELENLSTYLNKIGTEVSRVAIQALKEQLDEEARNFESFVKSNAPIPSLADKFYITKFETGNRYGYEFGWTGTTRTGLHNEALANIYNTGTSRIAPTYFKTRSVRRLKGLDGRAYNRFIVELNNLPLEG